MTVMGDFSKIRHLAGLIKPSLVLFCVYLLLCMMAARSGNRLGSLDGNSVVFDWFEPAVDISQALAGVALCALLARRRKHALPSQAHRMLVYGGCALSLIGAAGLTTCILGPNAEPSGGAVARFVVSGVLFGSGTLALYGIWGLRFARESTASILLNLGVAHLVTGLLRFAFSFAGEYAMLGLLTAAAVANTVVLIAKERKRDDAEAAAIPPSSTGLLDSLLDRQLTGERRSLLLQASVPLLGVVVYSLNKGALQSAQAFDPALVAAPAIALLVIVAALLGARRGGSAFGLCYVAFPAIATLQLFARTIEPVAQSPWVGVLFVTLFVMADIVLWAVLAQLAKTEVASLILFIACKTLVALASIAGSSLGFLWSPAANGLMLAATTAYFVYALVVAYPVLGRELAARRRFRAYDTADGGSATPPPVAACDAKKSEVPETSIADAANSGNPSATLPLSPNPAASDEAFPAVSEAEHKPRLQPRPQSPSQTLPQGAAPFDLESRVRTLSQAHGLTSREEEVLGYLAKGFGSPHIAKVLFISENTARSHMKAIYRKMAVGSRDELIELIHSGRSYL